MPNGQARDGAKVWRRGDGGYKGVAISAIANIDPLGFVPHPNLRNNRPSPL